MSKLMYRVYARSIYPRYKADRKYNLLAAFLYKEDAEWFIRDRLNSEGIEHRETEYKIMQGNRNLEVYNAE